MPKLPVEAERISFGSSEVTPTGVLGPAAWNCRMSDLPRPHPATAWRRTGQRCVSPGRGVAGINREFAWGYDRGSARHGVAMDGRNHDLAVQTPLGGGTRAISSFRYRCAAERYAPWSHARPM